MLRSLSRPDQGRHSVSALGAGILAVLTLGMLPLLTLRRRFRQYVLQERQQYSYLAQWLRERSDSGEEEIFADAVNTICYRRWIHVVQGLALLGILSVFVTQASHWQAGFGAVMGRTFRFSRLGLEQSQALYACFAAWNGGLMIAYLLQALQVHLHGREIERVLNRLPNEMKADDAIHPPVQQGGIAWVVAGLIVTLLGGLWGFAMALVGWTQRRYIEATAERNRGGLRRRVRSLMQENPPVRAIDRHTTHRPRCPNEQCRSNLPMGARFCPRCGAALVAPVMV